MKSMNRRRGRPRGEHTRGPDLGTPEAQRKRIELVGGAPPELAEYPLGILLARRLITREQHDAGCHYAYLRGKALGNTTIFGMFRALFPAAGGRALDEDAQACVEARWRAAANQLLAAGRPAKDAVDNAAIYLRLPRWLKPALADGGGRQRLRLGDRREKEALAAGLRVLASHFCLGAKRAARDGAARPPQVCGERDALPRQAAAIQPPAHGARLRPSDNDSYHGLTNA